MINKSLLTLLLTILLLCTGCREKSSKPEEKIILTVDQYLFDPDGGFDSREKEFYSRFMEDHPDIEIKITEIFTTESFHSTREQEKITADNITDIVYYRGSSALTRDGLIAPITPYLTEEIKKSYLKTALLAQGEREELYTLPVTVIASHVLYVNQKLLNEMQLSMPQNFKEMTALVPTVKSHGNDFIIMGNRSDWVLPYTLFSAIVGRLNGKHWAQHVASNDSSFLDPAFIDSLNMVKNLFDKELLSRASYELEYGESYLLFAEGQAPFMIDGDWRAEQLAELMSVEKQKDIIMTVLPELPGQKSSQNSTSLIPGLGLSMKSGLNDDKAYAAWKLISYYAGIKEAQLRLEQEYIVPSLKMNRVPPNLPYLVKEKIKFHQQLDEALPDLAYTFNGLLHERLRLGLKALIQGEIGPEELALELEKQNNKR